MNGELQLATYQQSSLLRLIQKNCEMWNEYVKRLMLVWASGRQRDKEIGFEPVKKNSDFVVAAAAVARGGMSFLTIDFFPTLHSVAFIHLNAHTLACPCFLFLSPFCFLSINSIIYIISSISKENHTTHSKFFHTWFPCSYSRWPAIWGSLLFIA